MKAQTLRGFDRMMKECVNKLGNGWVLHDIEEAIGNILVTASRDDVLVIVKSIETASWHLRASEHPEAQMIIVALSLARGICLEYRNGLHEATCAECKQRLQNVYYVMDYTGCGFGMGCEATGNHFRVCKSCKDILVKEPNRDGNFVHEVKEENNERYVNTQELLQLLHMPLEKTPMSRKLKVYCMRKRGSAKYVGDIYGTRHGDNVALIEMFVRIGLPVNNYSLPFELVARAISCCNDWNAEQRLIKKLHTVCIYAIPELLEKNAEDIHAIGCTDKEIDTIRQMLQRRDCHLAGETLPSKEPQEDGKAEETLDSIIQEPAISEKLRQYGVTKWYNLTDKSAQDLEINGFTAREIKKIRIRLLKSQKHLRNDPLGA